MLDRITVHGARQHNLKNIDVEIPPRPLFLQQALALKNGLRIMILAPVVRGRKGEYRHGLGLFLDPKSNRFSHIHTHLRPARYPSGGNPRR